MVRVLSLGAGVQSSTLALMAAAGEFEAGPDVAIFADTGWEPRAVYEHLDRLESMLPFPVRRVSAGNIRDAILARKNTTGQRFAAIPWFIQFPDGSPGMGRRQCTHEYKLQPIIREIRRVLGVDPRAPIAAGEVEQWIGISVDEASRMKDSPRRYVVNRFPLIERNMTRAACVEWLTRHGYPVPPKSSCIGCPFHSARTWVQLRDSAPAEFADAVEVDRQLRIGHTRGIRGAEFMHVRRMPLAEAVELDAAACADDDRQLDLFAAFECEGMCGV